MMLNVFSSLVGFHVSSHVIRSFVNDHTLLSKDYLVSEVKENFVGDCKLFVTSFALSWTERFVINSIVKYLDPEPEMFTIGLQAKVTDEQNSNIHSFVERIPAQTAPVPTIRRFLINYGSRCVILGVTYPLRTLIILLQSKQITFEACKHYFNGTLPITNLYCGFGYHFVWKTLHSLATAFNNYITYRIALKSYNLDDDTAPNYTIQIVSSIGTAGVYFSLEAIKLYGLFARLGLGKPVITFRNLIAAMFT